MGYGHRDLWKVFGYPTTISIEEYWRRYQRGGLSNRIIRAYPDACWNATPIIQDERGSSPKKTQKDYSPFTEAWEDLQDRFQVISYLNRADRLGRVGHYSILIMGFEGDGSLEEPLGNKVAKLLYLAPYAQKSVTISKWEKDASSPRYGLPEIYQVTPAGKSGLGTFKVHHSRVIHIAENTDEDDVFGEPALRSIWNNLLDLEKVLGSGAETFWLNARGGISVEADANATLKEPQLQDMKKQVEGYSNEQTRFLALQGAKVTPISTTVSDPKSNVDIQIQQISGSKGIPQRILTGTERGELASTEDANSWESRVDERRRSHCGPNILRPFIQTMILTGNLPKPQGNWFAQWPEASAASPEKQAQIASARIQAASTWANGNADRVVAKEEVRVMIGLPPESEYDIDEEDPEDDDIDDEGNVVDPLNPGDPEDDPEDEPED